MNIIRRLHRLQRRGLPLSAYNPATYNLNALSPTRRFLAPTLTLTGSAWNPELDLPETEHRILSPTEFHSGVSIVGDFMLVRYLDEHPHAISSLSARQFEELVASLLKKSGYTVQLSPEGRDGGIDVFAERAGEFGPELTLVQCKRYRQDRKVGEPIVKQLYATVAIRGATRGLLVAASMFTADALRLIHDVRYRVAGKDLQQLKRWISRLREKWDQETALSETAAPENPEPD